MAKKETNYKLVFDLLEQYRAHANQLERQVSELTPYVDYEKINPHLEQSLQKIRAFRDSLWAIDKALEIQKNKSELEKESTKKEQ